jgi:hypothetical protein
MTGIRRASTREACNPVARVLTSQHYRNGREVILTINDVPVLMTSRNTTYRNGRDSSLRAKHRIKKKTIAPYTCDAGSGGRRFNRVYCSRKTELNL